jgi:flagellar assembly protein FliH
MSSSKILKNSNFFIPEKILSPNRDQQPGWKSAAIPVEKVNNASREESVYSPVLQHHYPDEQDISGLEKNESPELSHPENDPASSPLKTQELDRLQEEAYNRGMRDGLKIAEEDLGSSVKALVMACEQVNMLRQTILNNSMNEMEDLVLIIAEKIIRHSVTEQDRTIVDTVEEAIRQAVRSDELIIEINPADLSVIRAKSKELIDSLSGLENIVVRANPAIERGGCTIDSSTSTVDATMASQLRIIEEKIKGKT